MKRILACQLFLLAFHIAAAAETVPCRYGCAYYPEAWPESRWETDMRLMREAVGPDMGLKAAGGIRTCEDALAMLRAGATRLGTSAGRAIVEGLNS